MSPSLFTSEGLEGSWSQHDYGGVVTRSYGALHKLEVYPCPRVISDNFFTLTTFSLLFYLLKKFSLLTIPLSFKTLCNPSSLCWTVPFREPLSLFVGDNASLGEFTYRVSHTWYGP